MPATNRAMGPTIYGQPGQGTPEAGSVPPPAPVPDGPPVASGSATESAPASNGDEGSGATDTGSDSDEGEGSDESEPVPPDGDVGTVDPSAAEVRAWAQENGVPVSSRGKIAADVYEQYQAAQVEQVA